MRIDENFQLRHVPAIDEKAQDILALDAEIGSCLGEFGRIHFGIRKGSPCLAGAVLETARKMLGLLQRREQIDARISDTENVFRLEHIIRELKDAPADSHVGKNTLERLQGLLQKNAKGMV